MGVNGVLLDTTSASIGVPLGLPPQWSRLVASISPKTASRAGIRYTVTFS